MYKWLGNDQRHKLLHTVLPKFIKGKCTQYIKVTKYTCVGTCTCAFTYQHTRPVCYVQQRYTYEWWTFYFQLVWEIWAHLLYEYYIMHLKHIPFIITSEYKKSVQQLSSLCFKVMKWSKYWFCRVLSSSSYLFTWIVVKLLREGRQDCSDNYCICHSTEQDSYLYPTHKHLNIKL